MLFFADQRLALLANTKSASSAVEAALASRASIALTSPASIKHIGYRKFMRWVHPLIESQLGLKRENYDVVAVMREPMDWLHSWYRYRSRSDISGSKNYSGHVDFETFVRAFVSETPPDYAKVGLQTRMFEYRKGTIGLDRIFRYDRIEQFVAFLEERLDQKIKLDERNVSPQAPYALDKGLEAEARTKLQKAVDLYAALREDGVLSAEARAIDIKVGQKEA